jgi:hypothetical protein
VKQSTKRAQQIKKGHTICCHLIELVAFLHLPQLPAQGIFSEHSGFAKNMQATLHQRLTSLEEKAFAG